MRYIVIKHPTLKSFFAVEDTHKDEQVTKWVSHSTARERADALNGEQFIENQIAEYGASGIADAIHRITGD